MLLSISIVLASLIIIGALVQTIAAAVIIRKLGREFPEIDQREDYPPVAVVLSLRGGDPFLYDCLTRLAEQNYPDYQVIIALDNAADPAKEIVDRLIAEKRPAHWTVRVIEEFRSTCTLVNNNYSRIIEELDPKYEVVVLVDADAVTWPKWLATLVTPLVNDPSVGATSGNRWFTPPSTKIGSLSRAFWNMGSLIQMALFDYPWGGSLAIRADLAKHPKMLQRWQTSFTGDTPIYQFLREVGQQYVFNPNVILINREETSLSSFANWMPRQMLNGRLYHPNWRPVFWQAILSAVVVIVASAVNLFNIAMGDWAALAVLGGALILFWMVSHWTYLIMNRTILEKAGNRQVETLGLVKGCWMFLLIPVVLAVYFYGVLKCQLIREVNWRGIDYRIEGPWKIRRKQYQPFQNPVGKNPESL